MLEIFLILGAAAGGYATGKVVTKRRLQTSSALTGTSLIVPQTPVIDAVQVAKPAADAPPSFKPSEAAPPVPAATSSLPAAAKASQEWRAKREVARLDALEASGELELSAQYSAALAARMKPLMSLYMPIRDDGKLATLLAANGPQSKQIHVRTPGRFMAGLAECTDPYAVLVVAVDQLADFEIAVLKQMLRQGMPAPFPPLLDTTIVVTLENPPSLKSHRHRDRRAAIARDKRFGWLVDACDVVVLPAVDPAEQVIAAAEQMIAAAAAQMDLRVELGDDDRAAIGRQLKLGDVAGWIDDTVAPLLRQAAMDARTVRLEVGDSVRVIAEDGAAIHPPATTAPQAAVTPAGSELSPEDDPANYADAGWSDADESSPVMTVDPEPEAEADPAPEKPKRTRKAKTEVVD